MDLESETLVTVDPVGIATPIRKVLLEAVVVMVDVVRDVPLFVVAFTLVPMPILVNLRVGRVREG